MWAWNFCLVYNCSYNRKVSINFLILLIVFGRTFCLNYRGNYLPLLVRIKVLLIFLLWGFFNWFSGIVSFLLQIAFSLLIYLRARYWRWQGVRSTFILWNWYPVKVFVVRKIMFWQMDSTCLVWLVCTWLQILWI